MAHKVEYCDYKISSSTKGGVEVEAGISQDEDKQKLSENAEDAFGPWVLVARKRQSNRNTPKGRSQSPHLGANDQHPRPSNTPTPFRRALVSNKADAVNQENARKSFLKPAISPNRDELFNEPDTLFKPILGGKVLVVKPNTSGPKPMKTKKKNREVMGRKVNTKISSSIWKEVGIAPFTQSTAVGNGIRSMGLSDVLGIEFREFKAEGSCDPTVNPIGEGAHAEEQDFDMGKGQIELKVVELMEVASGDDGMESISRSTLARSPLMEIANQENVNSSEHAITRFFSSSLKQIDPALRSGQRAKDETNEGVKGKLHHE